MIARTREPRVRARGVARCLQPSLGCASCWNCAQVTPSRVPRHVHLNERHISLIFSSLCASNKLHTCYESLKLRMIYNIYFRKMYDPVYAPLIQRSLLVR